MPEQRSSTHLSCPDLPSVCTPAEKQKKESYHTVQTRQDCFEIRADTCRVLVWVKSDERRRQKTPGRAKACSRAQQTPLLCRDAALTPYLDQNSGISKQGEKSNATGIWPAQLTGRSGRPCPLHLYPPVGPGCHRERAYVTRPGGRSPRALYRARLPPVVSCEQSFIHLSLVSRGASLISSLPSFLVCSSHPSLPSPCCNSSLPRSRSLDQFLRTRSPARRKASRHGFARHHPHGHRRHRQWNRPGPLPVPSADVLPHLEEAVGGAVLGGAVPGDAAQLHDVGALRPPRGAPAQHARHHHQRHGDGHRALLRRALPRLLRRRRPPPRAPHPCRRGRLRRRRRRARPQPRAHPRPPLHDRRHPLRPLRHRHVRRPPLRHENGDPDKERGVHAPVPVPGLPRQRHLLDCLRAHPFRPLHHDPEWAGRAVRRGAGDPVRHLLQVDAADPRGPQAQGRRHDRGRRRRQRHLRWRQCRRPSLAEEEQLLLTRCPGALASWAMAPPAAAAAYKP